MMKLVYERTPALGAPVCLIENKEDVSSGQAPVCSRLAETAHGQTGSSTQERKCAELGPTTRNDAHT
jgi:hypothetical protein